MSYLSTKVSVKPLQSIWQLIQILPEIQTISCFSARSPMITQNPSGVARLGSSSQPFASKWVCAATLVHTVCERLGDTMLVCKVWILALIMYKLNHESIAYTKRYLGITDDELQAVVQRLNL